MLALFDIDGTLLLTDAGASALSRVFEQRFGIADAMRPIQCAGKTDPLIVHELFVSALGREPEDVELAEVLRAYELALADELQRADDFRLMPFALEALDLVADKPGAVLGVATGNTAAGARAKLSRAGMQGRFAIGGYGSDHRERSRLVARAIERGCAYAGRELAAHEVVVIGDTPRDIEAARACGVRVIAVATGSHELGELAHADAAIATLAELESALSDLAL